MKVEIHTGLTLLILLFVTLGCEKVTVPDPQPEEQEPVFFSDLQFGNSSLKLAAGIDNYHLDARFVREGDVMTFVGTFKPEDCQERQCPGSLRLAIRDVKPFDRASFNINQALREASYNYAWKLNRDSMVVKLNPHHSDPSTANSRIQWSFDARELNIDNNVVALVFDRHTSYTVELQQNFGQCQSRQIQTLHLAGNSCKCKIVLHNNSRMATVQASGAEPYTYKWSTGSDSVRTELKPLTDQLLWVEVTDANGCVSASEVRAPGTSGFRQDCIADFRTEVVGHLENIDKFQFRKVFVEYIDDGGNRFISNKFSQPRDAFFRVLSVTDFERNAEGHPTKKVNLELSCLLYNQRVDEALPLKGKISMAVAYPGN